MIKRAMITYELLAVVNSNPIAMPVRAHNGACV